jgi:phage terminase large subunit GpA-like protein
MHEFNLSTRIYYFIVYIIIYFILYTEFLQLSEEQWPKESLPTTNQAKEDQAERRKPRIILQVAKRHRVEFVEKIVDAFWKRWKRDVFPTLVPRKKWIVERRNVRIDDIVEMEETNAIRGSWTV